ncbi:hypothetical protein [Malonomonas rubra]|uniref:hypothetical protein n=1 Tax=Malonomonas rubra TaxID=57040 RepID=UPI001114DEC8|nr:hypothetical protein [Malonomonas rubra]
MFERQLKTLQRSDKKGAAAAIRAESLISSIASGQLSEEEMLSKLTKNGELRLSNCRKFDLGSGYRLISLREENSLCFAFVGTHDACDRWLNNRRAEGVTLNRSHLKSVCVNQDQVAETDLPEELLQAEAEYEAYLSSKLDDETLRAIFSGLCGY